MSNQVSARVQAIKPSPTLAITSKAAELRAAGRDIVALGAGEPDFPTPAHICEAAIRAINEGQTRYTAVDGTPALKQAVIDKFSRDNQLTYQADQILVSVGGKQSFFNLSIALLNDGDEVIIPAPYWVSYPDMVLLGGGKPVIVQATQEQHFKMSPTQLKASLTSKTKLVVLNSPSNPTGVAYSKTELEALGAVLREYPNVYIATDDMYEHILWSHEPFCNIVMACPDLYDRTFVLNGVSKAYSMTGWRIGYAAGPANIIKAMKKVQGQSTSNPCSISQAAAVEALNGPQECIQTMNRAFKKRHDIVLAQLNDMEGISCLPADGTFYLFPNVQTLMTNLGFSSDVDFASALLEQGDVAMVPGSAFGSNGHLRLSFATSQEQLDKALTKLQHFIKQSSKK